MSETMELSEMMADELEDARAEVAALNYLLEETRKELDDARTGRDIAAVYDEMERMRVALERERDNAREAANIRMAELGEEIDQLKEEADRREAVIVKMREALSIAGVCDLCGEEVARLAGHVERMAAAMVEGAVSYPQSLMARYQRPLAVWQARELPCEDKDKQTLRVALGVAEEVGEVAAAAGRLARCVLKRSQGIRGDADVWRGKACGEIGDVGVYLMQLCTLLDLDFEQCIHEAASKVLARRFATAKEVAG